MPEQNSSRDEQPPAYEGHAPNPFDFLDPDSQGLQDAMERGHNQASTHGSSGANYAQPPAYGGPPNPLAFLDPDSRARQSEIQRGLVEPPPAYAGAPNPLAFLDPDSRRRQEEISAGQIGQVNYSQGQIGPEAQALIAHYASSGRTSQQPARQRDGQGSSSAQQTSHHGSSRSGKRRR